MSSLVVTATFFSATDVPMVSPTTAPAITIRRTDTGADVVTDAAMTEVGEGTYRYDFTGDKTLHYTAVADGDPLAAGQTIAGGRYQSGGFMGADVGDTVWDRVLTGATHNIINSAGRILRQLKEGIGNVLDEGDFQAGGSTTTAVLALTAPAADSALPGSIVVDNVQNTFWVIVAYDGTTKIATIAPDRGITPGAGNAYIVTGNVFGVLIGDQLQVAENAILDATGTDHVAAGSIGQVLDRVQGFATQDNIVLDGGPLAFGGADATKPEYDSAGLMLEGRLRVFRTAANAAAATPGSVAIQTGELYRQHISATSPTTAGHADSYLSVRDT
jgi:hypothetical protein